MGRELAQQYADRWIAELAGQQHGVVAWFQLRAAGISRGLVDFRLAEGRLHIVYRGVYAVGHTVLTREGRQMAAVLAHGPSAVLSHRSAAEIWTIVRPSSSPLVHVTVPGRGARKRRPGILVHRVPEVASTEHDGIPITTVGWTLLDLAAGGDHRLLGQAVDGAERAGLIDRSALEPLLSTARPGVRALRTALDRYEGAPTRSELERCFLELCKDHGLPTPLVNAWRDGYEIDFLWPDHRLIVEVDGLDHATRAGMHGDHVRDAKLALLGYRTQRFTWLQVTEEPVVVVAVVRRLLAETEPSPSAFSLHARDKALRGAPDARWPQP